MNLRLGSFSFFCSLLLLVCMAGPWGCESTTTTTPDASQADGQQGSETNTQETGSGELPAAPDTVTSADVLTPEENATPPDRASDEMAADASVSVPWPDDLAADETGDSSPVEQAPVEKISSDVPPSPAQCQGKSTPKKKDDVLTLKHDNQDRKYRIHIPPTYDPTKPTPIILNMHGYSSDSWQQALLSDMNKHADAHGYIVVYPEGTRLVKSWNAGLCCPPGELNKADDVGFINALLDQLESDLCIDKRRIYATGMSNGGFMTHRLACELSQRIAAFGPVAGHLLYQPCQPKRPVPLMHFHGSDDTIVPYKGSAALKFPAVQESIDFWVKHNQCNTTPTRTFAKGDATCDTYGQCQANVTVTLCTIHGGGHTWPGGLVIPAGKTSKDISATDELWKFFQRYPLP